MLQQAGKQQWDKKNKYRVPAAYNEGDWVVVHHDWLPAWPRSTSNYPHFGPYQILSLDGHRITARWSPRLGGTLMGTAQQLKHHYGPENLCGKEWKLNNKEIGILDLYGAASAMEVEEELPDMKAEETDKEGFYLGKYILPHHYRQGLRFLALCEGVGVDEATWKPFSAFVPPERRQNSALVDDLSWDNLGDLLRLAEMLASKKKPKD